MADRRERIGDFNTALLAAFDGQQSKLWTAMPGVVKAFDPAKQVCQVQPTIMARIPLPGNLFEYVAMPLLLDCPVIFPGGGGFSLTFPIAVNDECLVVFASRCIDSWWDASGVQRPAELRMHDLSDGFVLVGPRSRPKAISSLNTSGAELRNASRGSFVHIDASGDITITTPGALNIVAATVNVNATTVNIAADVNITGALKNNGHLVGSTHVHSGVAVGGSNTGAPT